LGKLSTFARIHITGIVPFGQNDGHIALETGLFLQVHSYSKKNHASRGFASAPHKREKELKKKVLLPAC
jgi:hypothetical protein